MKHTLYDWSVISCDTVALSCFINTKKIKVLHIHLLCIQLAGRLTHTHTHTLRSARTTAVHTYAATNVTSTAFLIANNVVHV